MDSLIQTLDDHHEKKMKADATGNRPMETVGVYLKRERESKNLSLREVARLTKISELYLDCIEKDDFEKVPKGPYVKGYISSYSRMIGGDTKQALQLYDFANEVKNQAEASQVDLPPATGWKTSVASAFTSLVDWVNQSKIRFQRTSPQPADRIVQSNSATSVSAKKEESNDVAHPDEPKRATSDNAEDNRESSVLIHFSKFAQPSQASDTIDHAPEPVAKTGGISNKVKTISIYQKIVDFLKTIGIGLTSLLSDGATKLWPRHSRDLWVGLVALLLGVTILVFSGIGVYHVFFFDKQASITAETTLVAGQESTTAPSTLSPFTLSPSVIPHKTSKFKKPDSPLPPVTVLVPSPPVKRPPLPVQQPRAAKPVTDRNSPLPEKTKETAAIAEEETKQPANTNIEVLKATICFGIKDRMPDGIATVFPLSVKRIYVWSHIQADRYPTTIRHIYYHEGQVVNQVNLSVRSPFWRTWSLKNIDRDRYRGHWRVDITANDGNVLRRLYFEIE